MPDISGIDLAIKMKEQYPNSKVLLFSGHRRGPDSAAYTTFVPLMVLPTQPNTARKVVNRTIPGMPAGDRLRIVGSANASHVACLFARPRISDRKVSFEIQTGDSD